jgi:hypothetical protein
MAFEDFWLRYPRKVGKGAARDAYKAAINKGATHEEIVASLERNKDEWVKEGTQTKFIPHARTWLHQERYLNYERPKQEEALTLSPAERIQILLRDEPPPRVEPTQESKDRVKAMVEKVKRGIRVES